MRKITLCADDYGLNESVSHGIIQLLEKNVLSATSCMTNFSHWSTHAQWLQPFSSSKDLGVHFNLTEGHLLTKINPIALNQLILKTYFSKIKIQLFVDELSRQLDQFIEHVGRKPDFIDGHQHIHQFPQIRDALLQVYEKYFPDHQVYIRVPANSWKNVTDIKQAIIKLLGANQLKKILQKNKIPHNKSFYGIYDFNQSKNYPTLFSQFLTRCENGSLLMCHPGLESSDSPDEIAQSRWQEFQYLNSNDLQNLCQQQEIKVCRFNESN